MIIVIGSLAVRPRRKPELFSLVQPIITATRADEGGLSYKRLDDPCDPDASSVECWSDRDALKRHRKTGPFPRWREASQALVKEGQEGIGIDQADVLKRDAGVVAVS